MPIGIPEILFFLLLLEHFICLPAIFKKAGQTSWHGYVPVLQWLTWLKVVKRPWWWVILLIVPGVNFIMLTILHVETAIAFGQRSTAQQWFAGALPWAFLPKLAFKDEDAFIGPRDWTGKKKGFVREWGEAIVFAVVAASVIRVFFMEAFTIPTPSMEGSMLVGDYLFVSKMAYGPKVPQTPMSIPFIHNALPGKNLTPSYVEWFSLPYMRIPGFGDVERNDPVVFNFPHGDTVIVHPDYVGFDYYQIMKEEALCESVGMKRYHAAISQGLDDVVYTEYLKDPEANWAKARQNLGEDHTCKSCAAKVARNRGLGAPRSGISFPELRRRPIDKMENYVKRCVAVAGDELEIKDRVLYINGEPTKSPEMVQFNYSFFTSPSTMKKFQKELNIPASTIMRAREANGYVVPLTPQQKARIEKSDQVTEFTVRENVPQPGLMFPYSDNPAFTGWTVDDFGPIVLPSKGMTVDLTPESIDLYKRAITAYEGHTMELNESQVLIDGKPATTFTFTMDYYWMMGDNRHNSLDSRYWGFVPETHIVGKPVFTWFSKENEGHHGPNHNGIRWKRMFRLVD